MARTLEVRIVLRAQQFRSGLAGASSELNRWGVEVSKSADKAGASAAKLGLASAAAGKLIVLGIGGAMAVSAKAAIDFESSLAGVAKTTDLAGNAFDKANTPLMVFGQAIRNLALRIPVNVNDLNRIAELGGQLGISTPFLVEFTDVVARLGVTTNLSIEEAATGLARLANIMGTSERDFERLGSVLVELGNNFATTESEILTFALRIAPVGKTVGATEEEVFALAAALSSLGIPAERGGTAIQRLMIDMEGAVTSGGDKLEKFAAVAQMTVEEFSELWEKAPSEAFAAFVRGLDDINKAGGNVFGTLRNLGIIEQRTIQVLLASASGWETVAEAIETANAEGEEINALQIESARRFGTTASQLTLLGNAFNDLRIEVGGAILGSGGLAAAIDIMREFFGIIKDNLATIATLGKVIGGLAIARLALSFGELFSKGKAAWGVLKGIKLGADAAQSSMTRLQAAMALTNIAMTAAVIVAGLLFLRWGMAATKAAELRAAVRQLNDALESGVPATEAFLDSLRDQGALSEDARQALTELGISETQFVQAMLDGKSASDLLNGSLEKQRLEAVRLRDAIRQRAGDQEGIPEFLTEEQKRLLLFTDLMEAAQDTKEGFFEIKRNDLINSLFDSGQAVGKTREEMERLADEAIRIFGADVTETEFTTWVRNLESGLERGGKHVRDFANNFRDATRNVDVDWRDMVAGLGDEGAAMAEDWADDIVDEIDDFRERVAEHAADIRDEILGGLPTSDDYKKAADITEEGLKAILAAQDRYIEDVMSWTGALKFVQDNFSAETVSWFQNLDTQTQGAFGRLFETAPEKFANFVGEIDARYSQLNDVTATRIGNEMPALFQSGFDTMLAGAIQGADELGLTGEAAVNNIMEGLKMRMDLLGPQGAAEFEAFLFSIFGSEQQALAAGFDIGDPIVQGIINAFKTLASRSASVLADQANRIEKALHNDFETTSPSRMTYRIGEDLGTGLLLGIQDTLKGFDPFTLRMSSAAANQLPPIQVNVPSTTTSGGSKSVSVVINNPQTHNLREDVQLMSIWNRLAESTEGYGVG